MSLLVDAIQPALLRGVFAVNAPFPNQSFSDLLAYPRATYLASSQAETRTITLAFPTFTDVTHAMAADCRRLSLSWLQTSIDCWSSTEDKLSLPWGLIRLYYGAFYAAHIIVRLLGRACCWLEAGHLSQVDAVHRAAHGSAIQFRAEPGSYLCSIDGAGNDIVLSRVSAGNRGAHEALWHALDIAFRDRTPAILSGTLPSRDEQAAVAKLDEFRALGQAHGSVAWLSKIRNGIQYRFDHQVWHPTALDAKSRRALSGHANGWMQDPMTVDLAAVRASSMLQQFSSACCFLLALCRALLGKLEAASLSPQRSFVRQGAGSLADIRRFSRPCEIDQRRTA